MIKVGVIGYGKMGKLHSQVFKKLGCEIYDGYKLFNSKVYIVLSLKYKFD